MKARRLIIFILLIFVISTSITGCQKKIEEKITEKIIEDATGSKVDISKDTTTIETEQGETKMGTDLKWPKDKMGNLPELKANITMVIEDYDKEKDINLGMVYFDSLKNDDAEKYRESIIELNYKAIFETTSDDGFIYSGNNDNGEEVMFSYYYDGTGSLSYTDNQFMFVENPYDADFTGDDLPSEDVDMTDDVPWPEEFFNDIPELEGKITQVSSSSPQDKHVFIEYVTKEIAMDYLDTLKEIGFIVTPSESLSGSYITYEAGNEEGDYIVFDWSDSEYATINIIKSE